jgi:GMP synthase-like glutamine amidotransferase
MKSMRVHFFQHVPFEGLGSIEGWICRKGYSLSSTLFYENQCLPEIQEVDFLLVMGGPMSVNDERDFTWLKQEKEFIREMVKAGKPVLGICLGAQLLASALGARVYPNVRKEIGWFPVTKTSMGQKEDLMEDFDVSCTVFHWHGDTFEIPAGAKPLMKSEICENQAFLYGENALGLQFHLEVTTETLKGMVEHGMHELGQDVWVQGAEEILSETGCLEANNLKMNGLLDRLAEKAKLL